MTQRTLAIFKPDLVARPRSVISALDAIQAQGLAVVHSERRHLTLPEAEDFYAEHKGKFFFPRLTTYMCSGPIMPLVIEGDDAVVRWRALLGKTKPPLARNDTTCPGNLRALYGVTDTRNSFHGADSRKSANREIGFFFPDWADHGVDYDLTID
eukprot:Clim_evm38s231 gene=Clim_evmTU38s231